MRFFMLSLVFIVLIAMLSLVDSMIYKTTVFTEFIRILQVEKGTNEWMVSYFLLIGFVFAIVADRKEKKQKNRKKS